MNATIIEPRNVTLELWRNAEVGKRVEITYLCPRHEATMFAKFVYTEFGFWARLDGKMISSEDIVAACNNAVVGIYWNW